ncbi:hypothetical protein [Mycolicibacterium rhodesiae]|uniref:Uncharacterized protein n=1 Tax=Mycolicibacterium rhodesiae TaxID=36814 RepID=A0A1X0IUL9_MYCRH|nr:hypothetical protein [Mycolicibacterium rhodesiae]MCV7346035.1 hypothetical protein [Mycolicibacterium rhodesiae]ORB52330.1 hypothetical protein BST42_15340 [Mycolicibacterium rhodesiae]
MSVSPVSSSSVTLSPIYGALAAAAGAVSLFATYWDDAWHTDIGRDAALIPPHLALYGGVAVTGLVVVGWALVALVRTRSIRAALRQPGLLLAGLGGAVTLAAAPLDAFWHDRFGRDAVLWSPPHMLVVFASATMAIGLLAGLRPTKRGIVEAALSALVLGSVMMTVLEYDTDVPQFSQTFYLPVVLVAGLFSVAIVRALVPRAYAVTRTLVFYVAMRVLVVAALVMLGRSTPDLPVAVLGLAVADLPWRGPAARYGATAAAVAALAWIAAAFGVASQPAAEIGVVAAPVIVVGMALALATSWRNRPAGATAAALLVGAAILTLGPAPRALAHDPGQGKPVTAVQLTVISDGRGEVRMDAVTADASSRLMAHRVVARRGGQTLTAPLTELGAGRFTGTIPLPEEGRWFVYVEFTRAGEPIEAWLPVETGWQGTVSAERELYVPAGAQAPTTAQIAFGTAIYAVGLALLGLAIMQTRRLVRRRQSEA